jgi:hypothetical protein
MNGKELLRQLDHQELKNCRFIKLWRKENDFIDIELIDTFRDTVKAGDEFSDFELLNMEQLWDIVKKICGDRISRKGIDSNEMIVWDRVDKHGIKSSNQCSYSPEFLIQIFDIETRGNYID